ncbi:SUMO1 sentrin specific peptidase 1 [Coemansia guatemalensis]|uniref:SUMO1 sentrin specific peptidase 1 n=1 Tax=Coemansia guatemalensis TaxID=2761395 RepID=A0A9W8LSK3_9FUNG|nr:SUMO1 sentrin specific peptidase 1 [Coemansia guatemalensis]
MASGIKRARVAEPGEIPGGFPGTSQATTKRRLDNWTVKSKDAGRSNAASRSGSEVEWLVSYILSPLRMAKDWLTGSSATPNTNASSTQRIHKETYSAAGLQRTETGNWKTQPRSVYEDQNFLEQQRQRRRRKQQRIAGTPRRSLLGSGSRSAHSRTRRTRNSILVREYTRPQRMEWRESPSVATSTVAADEERYDVRSILSVDSSLGFRDSTPATEISQALAGSNTREKSRARDTKADVRSGLADAWIAQLQRKIKETLSVSLPASTIHTPAYDLLCKAEDSFDARIARARAERAFTLPADAPSVIKQATASGFSAELNNVPVSAHDMATLGAGKWLNDEVINFYMQLIMTRSQKTPALPKVHAFNTFFYSTLSDKGYARVRRWTRRTKIFEQDMIIVPVHLGVHWCCAVIDFRSKSIAYYDALLGDNPKCLRLLMNYLHEESKDKEGQDFDEDGWSLKCEKEIPRQHNGYDCGVFAIMFAEYVSRDAPLSFSQENLPFLRRKATYEIATGSLVLPS